MATSNIFLITHNDIEQSLNAMDDSRLFQIADSGGNLTPDQAINIVNAMEDVVIGYIPKKYRDVLFKVKDNGLVLVDYASEGQTTATIPLYPVVSGTLKLYKNYGRNWRNRTSSDQISSEEYSLNTATGVVTFSPALEDGDSVFAEFEHQALSRCESLRRAAINFSCVEIAKQFQFMRTQDDYTRYERWWTETRELLIDLGYNRTSLHLFDNVEYLSGARRRNNKEIRINPFLW